jgi:hypothetical protein
VIRRGRIGKYRTVKMSKEKAALKLREIDDQIKTLSAKLQGSPSHRQLIKARLVSLRQARSSYASYLRVL